MIDKHNSLNYYTGIYKLMYIKKATQVMKQNCSIVKPDPTPHRKHAL